MRITLRKMVVAACVGVMMLLLDTGLAAGRFQETPREGATVYTCPMDPLIRSTIPGKCPRCGMALRLAGDSSSLPSGNPASLPGLETRPDGSIAGLKIPDVPVVDQDGRRLRFFTDLVKGRTVAINFMFTTCTTICPPLAVTFAKVQRELRADLSNDVLLISVSVDPVTDIPPRMKAYLSKFGAGPGWVFVGGAKPDIDNLLRALGVFVSDKNEHSPMVLIGNEKANTWTRAFGLAPASKLASLINEVKSRSPSSQLSSQ